MNETIMQSVFWVATLGLLVLFLQRRRRRKANY
jgi:MYXO-CTERM domain-containing protein